MTAQDVLDACAASRPMGEWLTYRECGLGTRTSRIDLFAMRCWQSGVGYRRVAFEIKISRGDFLSELARPEKRAAALEVTHEFYFACPAGLIRPEEIPGECGLVYVHPERVWPEVIVKAPLREARPLTDREVVYLARFPYYREGIEQERIELARLRSEVKQLRTALRNTAKQVTVTPTRTTRASRPPRSLIL